jgi:signal transduction histidine kinase/ActR/RegA family two-component response regulator
MGRKPLRIQFRLFLCIAASIAFLLVLAIYLKTALESIPRFSPDVLAGEKQHISPQASQRLHEQIDSLNRELDIEIHQRVTNMWIGTSVVILFVWLIQHVMAQSIIRPINQLTRDVRRIQEGDFNTRVDLKTSDEFETLGDAFNAMADSIRASRVDLEATNRKLSVQQAELEKLVAEKTEELKHTLESVEGERSKLQTIINRMPDGLVLIDGHGVFLSANEASLKILGHDNLKSLQDWLDNLPGAFNFRHLNHQSATFDEFPFNRAWRGDTFSNVVLYTRTPSNASKLLSFSGGPIAGSGLGHTQLAICIFRDVTEELSLRKELEEKNLELADASRMKDEFLATLSHELRTPLTPVISATQLLREGGRLSEDDLKTLALIERNAQSLSRMIDEMLDLSGIMNRKLHLNLEPTELNEWARNVISGQAPLLSKKQATCEFVAASGPIVYEIDQGRLTQVLTNLLSNAVKYSDPGGKIVVTLTQTDSEIRFAVRDNGIGLTKRELGEIFELFYQGQASYLRQSGGLGIGLSVARSLAELHGGGLIAQSDGPGLGSTFTLWMPRVRTGVPGQNASPIFAKHAPKPPLDRSLLRGRRILLVEDSLDTLEALRRLLLRRECQVLTAQSAEEGLECALKERPEILISDLNLPAMDGYEFIRRLRKDGNFKDLIAISVSGQGREQDVAASLDAGFTAHMLKPIDINKLDVTLVEALQGRNVFNPESLL